MPDLIFDIAAWKAANSLRGIKENNQDDAQTRRIKMLAEVLPTVTDPSMKAQIKSLLQAALDDIDENVIRAKNRADERRWYIGSSLFALFAIPFAVLCQGFIHLPH